MNKQAEKVYLDLLAKSHVFGNPVKLDFQELSSHTGFSIAVCKYLLKKLIRAEYIKPASYRDNSKIIVYNIYENDPELIKQIN